MLEAISLNHYFAKEIFSNAFSEKNSIPNKAELFLLSIIYLGERINIFLFLG